MALYTADYYRNDAMSEEVVLILSFGGQMMVCLTSRGPSFPLGVVTDTGGRVHLEISNAGCDHFWECAYRHPLKVAAQQFALLNRIMRDRKVAGSVIISRGCLEHDYYNSPLQLRLQQLAEDAGLPRPHFERDIHDREQSSATRGAIATVEYLYALTARQFITQDIGIGLQRKLPNPRTILCIFKQCHGQLLLLLVHNPPRSVHSINHFVLIGTLCVSVFELQSPLLTNMKPEVH